MGKKKNRQKRKRNNTTTPSNLSTTTPDEKNAIDTETGNVMNNSSKNKKRQKRASATKNVSSSPQSQGKKKHQNQQLSLASQLKRQRGTAALTPLPPEWSRICTYTENDKPIPKFLSPANHNNDDDDDDDFTSCHKECYNGFQWEEPNDLPSSLHNSFQRSFHTLNDAGLFLYDVVQPGGKRLSKTFVTRTLIGNPGSTYKYLGLRLFSHPWSDVDERGDAFDDDDTKEKKSVSSIKSTRLVKSIGYTPACARALLEIGNINTSLVHRTQNMLDENITPSLQQQGTNNMVTTTGSAEYSLTLINRMEPSSIKKDLKTETLHGMEGRTSVSWHKDSGLQDFSSIAIYHTVENDGLSGRAGGDNCVRDDAIKRSKKTKNKRNDTDDNNDHSPLLPWRVALRIADSNTRTPALSVPLPSGALYYLLDDFNHQHEHAVLAGSDSLRYSSTHRVAREGVGTWQYIRDRCEFILSSELHKLLCQGREGVLERRRRQELSSTSTTPFVVFTKKQIAKEVGSYLQLMKELEFEWIRQWNIQGKHHADLHPYWKEPIQIMTDSFKRLQIVCIHVTQILKESLSVCLSSNKASTGTKEDEAFLLDFLASEDLFDVLIENMEERQKLSDTWSQRLKDPIFGTLDKSMRPIAYCSNIVDNEENIPSSLTLRRWKSDFMSYQNSKDNDYDEKTQEQQTSGWKKKKRKTNKDEKKAASMTKKERKKVASNWQKMKALMKK